jgi:hypothetical protein
MKILMELHDIIVRTCDKRKIAIYDSFEYFFKTENLSFLVGIPDAYVKDHINENQLGSQTSNRFLRDIM